MTARDHIRPLPSQPPLFVLPTPERPVLVSKPTPSTRSLNTLAISTLRILGLELVKAGYGDQDTAILPMVRRLIRTVATLRGELKAARLENLVLRRQLAKCQEDKKEVGSGHENSHL